MKILIVDDEADLVDTCVRFLQMGGYSCLRAHTAQQATDAIDRDKPDVVIADVNLPDGDGFSLARYARRALPDSAVIIMTAYHTPATAEDARAAGAQAYLRKPFAMAELSAMMKRMNQNGNAAKD